MRFDRVRTTTDEKLSIRCGVTIRLHSQLVLMVGRVGVKLVTLVTGRASSIFDRLAPSYCEAKVRSTFLITCDVAPEFGEERALLLSLERKKSISAAVLTLYVVWFCGCSLRNWNGVKGNIRREVFVCAKACNRDLLSTLYNL